MFSAGSLTLEDACSVELERSRDMFHIKVTKTGPRCERWYMLFGVLSPKSMYFPYTSHVLQLSLD